MADNIMDQHTPPNKFGTRHVQALLLFLGITMSYGLRVCMSVAIVAMRNKKSANPNFPEYDWDNATSGIILSSFFWGYVITQVPSGYLANTRISARKLLMFGVLLSSVINLFMPLLADYGPIPVICCRILMGLCQGSLLPCVQTLLSRWVPPLERGRIGSFVMNGSQFATVITMPISGALAVSSIGWPSIFYLFGALGILWSIVFYWTGADHPSSHPRICQNEVRYIEGSLGKINKPNNSMQALKVPWKNILTSVPMWAIAIAHCGHNWGFYTLLTEMPTYMKDILKFDTSKSGSISALPYLGMILLALPMSYFADFATRKGVSTAITRKVCNTIGMWGPGMAMVALCLVKTEDPTIIVAILVLAVSLNSGITCGFQINHIDLSPNFAGTLMSITNFLANVVGILAPLACGAITKEGNDPSTWTIVFAITAALYFSTNLVFIIFGKAEIVWWNNPEGGTNVSRFPRVSVISIGGEPTSMAIPEPICDEEDIKTPC